MKNKDFIDINVRGNENSLWTYDGLPKNESQSLQLINKLIKDLEKGHSTTSDDDALISSDSDDKSVLEKRRLKDQVSKLGDPNREKAKTLEEI